MGGGFQGGSNPRDRGDRDANKDENRINERIRVPQVFLIDETGAQLGVYDTYIAIKMAKERGLDLVEVAPTARPPVCKILDYGKLKYTKKKKAAEAKKKQVVVDVKEIQLRPRTEAHDFETKFRHIKEFLTRGDKVKITVMFRGREIAYSKQGFEMLERIVEGTKDIALVESPAKMEGRRIIMVIAPGKAKAATPTAPQGPSPGGSGPKA
jgi:translation initiation factor IF-3